MERSELETFVEQDYSLQKLATKFDVSLGTIRHWLKKHGLKTNGCRSRINRRRIVACRLCAESDLSKFYKRRGDQTYGVCIECFKKTHGKKKLEKSRAIKEEWVSYKGGKCEECEYNRCIAALEFHHLDPAEKDPKWKSCVTGIWIEFAVN